MSFVREVDHAWHVDAAIDAAAVIDRKAKKVLAEGGTHDIRKEL